MKIGITADCSSGLEYAPFKHNVKITRTTINFEDKCLIDGIDINADEFYLLLEENDYVPSTAAPTMGEIVAKVEEWRKEGCTDVIHFPISYGLSTYGENLKKISDELFEDINVHVFNTREACLMEGYLAYYAEILSTKGYSVEAIFTECEKLRNQITAYFVVDDLRYLVKNGRLSVAAGLIGSLVNIKPILWINEEGKIVPFEKVRTHNKAVKRIEEIIIEDGQKYEEVIYIVLHANRRDLAEAFAEELRKQVTNARRIEITTITPTVGAHIGSGLLGVACIGVDGLKEKL